MRRQAYLAGALAFIFFLCGCGGQAGAAERLRGTVDAETEANTVETTVDAAESAADAAELTMREAESAAVALESAALTAEITGGIQMKIRVKAGETAIDYVLNDSQAARDLYEQLPLTLEVENFSTNEKVFYPPEKLDVRDAPMADAGLGTLAYYAPWGDVVMFYDAFGRGSGLYELGEAVSGEEMIEMLSGTIEVSAVEAEE